MLFDAINILFKSDYFDLFTSTSLVTFVFKENKQLRIQTVGIHEDIFLCNKLKMIHLFQIAPPILSSNSNLVLM